jgi:hypothetical protein
LADGSNSTATTSNITGVDVIYEDDWFYNLPVGAGVAGLGPKSALVESLKLFGDESGVILETGPITDQTFAGGAAVDSTKASL